VVEVDQRLRLDGYTNFYVDKKGQENSIFIIYIYIYLKPMACQSETIHSSRFSGEGKSLGCWWPFDLSHINGCLVVLTFSQLTTMELYGSLLM
jgi:hypothetical protein